MLVAKLLNPPAHRMTTAQLGSVYPFVAEAGLGDRGVLVGTEAFGGAFVYDAWELYRRGVLTNPNVFVFGDLGYGKSSLVKTVFLLRKLAFRNRRIWVLDPKSEYGTIARKLGLTPLELKPGGAVRLNPLTPRAGWESQIQLLAAVTEASLERKLHPEEREGLAEALRVVTARGAHQEPTLPEVVEVLLEPTTEMSGALKTSVPELAEKVRAAALALRRLCNGDLRSMFDAPTTVNLDLKAPLVVIDLSAVYDSPALGILMTCAMAWMRAEVANLREAAEREGQPGPEIGSIQDELWAVIGKEGIGEFFQANWKLSRAHGLQNVGVAHFLSDLTAAGGTGSRQALIAENLLSASQTRVLYRMPREQAELARSRLGLSSTVVGLIPKLKKGEAVWQVGERTFLVQHRLSAWEAQLVDTNQRMAAAA